jgi:hypothetical protein
VGDETGFIPILHIYTFMAQANSVDKDLHSSLFDLLGYFWPKSKQRRSDSTQMCWLIWI